MHSFWESHIEPIASIIGATHFLEIGAEFGTNTEKLMAFCHTTNGSLTVIDPAPKFDEDLLLQRYPGSRFQLFKDLSIHALPHVEAFEIGLIDGDHNWYTVFQELRLIEEKYHLRPAQFPILFFHDISWPYGRRDAYYDSSNIPSDHRQPARQAGIKLDQSELSDNCYFNGSIFNAIKEGGEKNGVLTAVEDFMEESQIRFDWLEFPELHGLGILVSEERKQKNKALVEYLDQIRLSAEEYQRMWESEKTRLNQLVQDEHDRIALEKKGNSHFHRLTRFKFKKG